MKKNLFLINLGLFFSAREEVLNSFKSKMFPIKKLDKVVARESAPEPATEPEVETELTKATKVSKAQTKRKISSLNLRENFEMKLKMKKKVLSIIFSKRFI